MRGTISIFRLGRETGVVSKRAVTDFWCLAPGVEYGDHPQTSHAGMAQKKRDAALLVGFALFGMVPSQFSYFMAVKYGNAPTATILQFLGPLFIIIYLAIANWQLPRRIDAISMAVALFGTYLLVTKGQFTSLQLAPPAIFFGV